MVGVGRDLWTSSSHPPLPSYSDSAIAYVSKLSDGKWCLEGLVGFVSRSIVQPRRQRECLFQSGGEALLLTTVHVSSYTYSFAREVLYLQGETWRRRQGLQRASEDGKCSWKSVSGPWGSSWGRRKGTCLLDSSMWGVPAETHSLPDTEQDCSSKWGVVKVKSYFYPQIAWEKLIDLLVTLDVTSWPLAGSCWGIYSMWVKLSCIQWPTDIYKSIRLKLCHQVIRGCWTSSGCWLLQAV